MFDVLFDVMQAKKSATAPIIGAQERNLNCGFLQDVIVRPSRPPGRDGVVAFQVLAPIKEMNWQ
jgi:hypothetical protein